MMRPMGKTAAVFGDFKRLSRGDREDFSELEWACATYLWRATGQRGGTVQYLFLTDEGEIDGEALETLREILDAAEAHALERPLNHDLTLSPAGATILEAAKKAGLAYIRSTDAADVLYEGSKRLGVLDELREHPRVPRLRDLPPVRSALAKLVTLAAGAGPLRFALAQR